MGWEREVLELRKNSFLNLIFLKTIKNAEADLQTNKLTDNSIDRSTDRLINIWNVL